MNKKVIIISSLILLLLALVTIMSKRHFQDKNQIEIQDTAAVIESTRPVGQLYLYSAVTEDWAKGTFDGSGIGSSILGEGRGLLKKKHDCMQILRQQVSFTVDMNKVEYEILPGSDTVIVLLPPVEFNQSTLGSWFKSDNENEEGAVKFNAEPLIKEVEQKIAKRYNTPDNVEKSRKRAEKVIAEFVGRCGKVAVFR